MEMTEARKPRITAANVRQTARDAHALEWLSQMYGAPLDVVARVCGVTEHRAYELAQRWRAAGWVERAKPDAGPMWVYPKPPTASAYLGWNAPPWVPRPTTAAHLRAVAEVRLALVGPSLENWRSERWLRHRQAEGRRKERGDKLTHVHDGLWLSPTGWEAVEVELTVKEPFRLKEKIQDVRIEADALGCRTAVYVVDGPVVRRAVQEAVNTVAASFNQVELTDLKIMDLSEVIGKQAEKETRR